MFGSGEKPVDKNIMIAVEEYHCAHWHYFAFSFSIVRNKTVKKIKILVNKSGYRAWFQIEPEN